MIRVLTCLALTAGLLFVWPQQAGAAESYDGCTGFINSLPTAISTQGTWCLKTNLSTGVTSGSAITIATNNVTIDCNGFKIGGLSAGVGTRTNGIGAKSRMNATIRNCNIRGFLRGIHLFGPGSGGHLVEDNALDSNTGAGVIVNNAPGSAIRNNQIVDTGGSTASANAASGIRASEGVDVVNNTVNGVAPASADADAYGIYTINNNAGSAVSNRVRGLAPAGNGTAYGIFNASSGRTAILGNIVQGPGSGMAGSEGIHCTNNLSAARSNVVLGFAAGIKNCFGSANVVSDN